MAKRVLIVDDEPLAREKLRDLLAGAHDFEIVGEAAAGIEAVKLIESLRPDLVFLDVKIPELDGFGVIERSSVRPLPAIIFMTAYDQYAVQAFEVNALDYLLKPFDRERLQTALERARQNRQDAEAEASIENKLQALLSEVSVARRVPERIAVKVSGRTLLIDVAEIEWVEAADNYVKLHHGSNETLMRETMAAMESRLAPLGFIRVSRSAIVHPRAIIELEPLFHGDQIIVLQSGDRVTLTRKYKSALRALVGGEM